MWTECGEGQCDRSWSLEGDNQLLGGGSDGCCRGELGERRGDREPFDGVRGTFGVGNADPSIPAPLADPVAAILSRSSPSAPVVAAAPSSPALFAANADPPSPVFIPLAATGIHTSDPSRPVAAATVAATPTCPAIVADAIAVAPRGPIIFSAAAACFGRRSL